MLSTSDCSAGMLALVSALLIIAQPVCADDGARGDTFVVAAAQTELRFWPSPDDFAEHMSQRVEAAMAHDPDLIVFPEDIGLPLVGIGDADALQGADTVEEAVGGMIARHSSEVDALVAEHGVSPCRGLWLLKTPAIREIYEETFASLAREHGVHIAAGSVPLVPPDHPSDIVNAACFFDPEGKMHIVGTKVHLVPLEREEGLDFASGAVEDYQAIRVSGATVGVIVCADAWDPAIAGALVDQGAGVLVQVSANPEVWSDGTRVGWREGLFARVQECGVYGVSAMAVGNLLRLPVQGRSAILAPREWTADGSGYLAEAESATSEAVIAATLDLRLSSGK